MHNQQPPALSNVDRVVVSQALDDSLGNREPVVKSQVLSQVVAIILSVLVMRGLIEAGESAALGMQMEVVIGAIFTIAAIVGSILGRSKASSPKTVAEVAITNAALPPSSTPTLNVDQATVEAAALRVS